jgi:hypothetical protein
MNFQHDCNGQYNGHSKRPSLMAEMADLLPLSSHTGRLLRSDTCR